MTLPEKRAGRAARILLKAKGGHFPCQQYDHCFEMGRTAEVIQELVKILEGEGVNSFESLPTSAQRYACREWFTKKEFA